MNNLSKTAAIVVAWIVFCGISLSNDRFPELIHVVGGVGALIALVVVGVAIYGVPC